MTAPCSVPGCSRVEKLRRTWCFPHYRRWLRHGSPTAGRRGRPRAPLPERVAKFTPAGAPDDCWEWAGARNNQGYGQISISENGKVRLLLAHRLALGFALGAPIPAGVLVLHACDNPPCVNPAHLSRGTHSENRQQMWDRGRR